jgi:putative DNA primase/helicase
LYHVKNKLKSFITGDYIRINPKNLMAYEERNHVNLVFLSNERMPVVLEEDDRRHAVIWTPEKTTEDFYKSVAEEKANGSVAAFHQFLLDVDLGDFSEHSKPPMTLAKKELIDLSKDTINRFFEEWEAGFIDGFTVMPVLSQDFYELYKIWCGKQGVKPGSQTKMVDMMLKRLFCTKKRARYLSAKHPQTFIFAENCPDVPLGASESSWLDKCVFEFRELLSNYRGRNYE